MNYKIMKRAIVSGNWHVLDGHDYIEKETAINIANGIPGDVRVIELRTEKVVWSSEAGPEMVMPLKREPTPFEFLVLVDGNPRAFFPNITLAVEYSGLLPKYDKLQIAELVEPSKALETGALLYTYNGDVYAIFHTSTREPQPDQPMGKIVTPEWNVLADRLNKLEARLDVNDEQHKYTVQNVHGIAERIFEAGTAFEAYSKRLDASDRSNKRLDAHLERLEHLAQSVATLEQQNKYTVSTVNSIGERLHAFETRLNAHAAMLDTDTAALSIIAKLKDLLGRVG